MAARVLAPRHGQLVGGRRVERRRRSAAGTLAVLSPPSPASSPDERREGLKAVKPRVRDPADAPSAGGLRFAASRPGGAGSAGLRAASPLVLEYPGPMGSTLFVGNDGPLEAGRPGNGGLRLWTYETRSEAIRECVGLTQGMTSKHATYNTGFNGAKLVVHAPDGPAAMDKRALMDCVAASLNDLDGAVFTGCDLNTGEDDMRYLDEICPYVLASLGATTDANVATAHSVYGAMQGALEALGRTVRGATVFVHGTGKVGSSVAKQLVESGAARVYTYDCRSESADIPGCTNVSDAEDWASIAATCDVLCPCSVSWLLTEEIVKGLRCSLIVGAANLPFETAAARAKACEMGIMSVPESVSSAGAVIVDSLECFDRPAYMAARPSEVYAFVRHLTRMGADDLVKDINRNSLSPGNIDNAVANLSVRSAEQVPAGARFKTWLDASTERVSSLVVGGGVAGSAAAMELAKAAAPGERVMLLESRKVAHDAASSYGESRMYRRMYSDEYFSKMQAVALDLWHDLEKESGLELLSENGLLFYGATDTGETVEGSVPGARDVMERLEIPHEYYVGEELDARWPLTSSATDEGVFELAAGSVHASNACRAMADLAGKSGAEVVEGEKVVDIWKPEGGGVCVATSEGRVVRTDRLAMCAGAWTNDLLRPLGVQLDLEVWKMHWGHFHVDPSLLGQYPQWFCFRKAEGEGAEEDGGLYYGFPAQDPSVPVIKVGVDWCPDTPAYKTSSMAEFSYEPEKHVVSCIEKFLAANWKGIGECIDMRCSPYTMTKDQYFILDRVPGHEEISVFTGGSGRAFKFGPLLGKLLAEVSLGCEMSYDVEPFRIRRDAAGLQQQAIGPKAGDAPEPEPLAA